MGFQANVRLEECLEDYTRLEVLRDCICRKCSMLATHRRLQQEVASLEEATRPDAKPSRSKKQRLRDVRKMEARVKAALDEGRIEEDLKDIRMEKVFSTASTKQAMIARVRSYSFLNHLTLNYPSASSHFGLTYQSLSPLWPICIQKYHSPHFPRSARSHSIHNLWKPLHHTNIRHLHSTTQSPPLNHAHTSNICYPTNNLPPLSRGVPLRATLLRALHLLSP